MELIVVGSGAAYPVRPGTASSTYLVRHADTTLCLDLGQGGFAGIAGEMPPEDLAAVVISHLHPDHFVDLVALRHFLRYEFDPPRRVRVIAPAGLADRLDGLMGEPGFAGAALEIETRAPGLLRVGPFVLESRRITHTNDSFGVRVSMAGSGTAEWGDGPSDRTAERTARGPNDVADSPGLVFSGDCGRAGDLAPLVRPGDTLLSEIAWGAGPPAPGIHLDGTSIGDLAAVTRPARVLLTHLQPRRDPALALAAVQARWAGPVRFVADGDRISL